MEAEKLIGMLEDKLGRYIAKTDKMPNNDLLLLIKKEDLLSVMDTLKNDPELRFNCLMNHLGVDYPESFAVIYNLYSFHVKRKVTVKAHIERENPEVDSLEPVFRGINWFERETYDLLGIKFRGHSNLKRLLLPPDWKGHPLRKDYVYPEEYNGMTLKREEHG
jgi:NADH-quinone oxidoreductase subunit C